MYSHLKKVMGSIELQLGTRVEKTWSKKWLSDFHFDFGLPLAVGSGESTSTDGTNFAFKAGVALGYRVGRDWTAWMGYDYEQVRLATQNSSTVADSVSQSQNGLRFGISTGF